MELTYDWRSFHSIFYPKKRTGIQPSAVRSGPVYLVVDGDIVISAFSESQDLAEWAGAPYQKMATEMPHRELVLFDRAKVDQWITGSLAQPHFYEQVEYMRREVTPQVHSKSKSKKISMELLVQRHFLLEALQGWWAKLLPSVYGIFIRLEGPASQDFFVVIRRGRIDSFHEPDLSSIGPDRRKQPADVVKYLSEKHLVPVQGVFVSTQEWLAWAESANPWKDVAVAVKANKAKLFPFRWGIVSLLAARGFLGF